MFRGAGLIDTLPGLVIAYAGFNLSFAVWMSMSFVRRVPKELVEAARLEGCTWMQVLWRIVLPLSRSGLAAVATFVFIFAWNEFLLALFLTTSRSQDIPGCDFLLREHGKGLLGLYRRGLRHPMPAAGAVLLLHAETHRVRHHDGRGEGLIIEPLTHLRWQEPM